MASTLRVMTLNIWNYNEPWTRRRALIAEAVREASPDVIGFQEIRHSGVRDENGKNQAQQLSDLLPEYRAVWQPAQENPEVDQWEGLVVFSRLPVLATDHVRLSRDPADPRDNHQRICLRAEVSTPAGRMQFLTTHLSLSGEGRARTVRELVAFTSRYEGDLPHVLVGDFNETPGQGPIRHVVEGGGFTDAWAHLHPGEPGVTFGPPNPYVTGTGRRIDYIFVETRGVRRLMACDRVGDRPGDDGHFPSDHFGLTADLSLSNA